MRLAKRAACAAGLSALLASVAWAADVSVVGLYPGKAVLVINGGAPRTVAVGATTAEGVKLIAAGDNVAVIESDGRRQQLRLGEIVSMAEAVDANKPVIVTLLPDRRGHYVAAGAVNGAPMKLMVDTGATFVSIGRSDAMRAGIDVGKAEVGLSQTANGVTHVWKVKLDTVRVGDITLRNVDGVVHSGDLPIALLGMSFLNRMEMKRDSDSLTLRQRF